jgi:poly-gamma-glutamate synthesis protein (capsule biosynthesis protein)
MSACGADPPRRPAPASAAPSFAASVEASPSPSAAAEITLAFAGDLYFTGRTLAPLDEPGTAIGPYAATLRAADFAMVNLETAVTTRGTPQPKRFHFRAPTSAYAALLAAGIDLVSIANNHTLDYGQLGSTDTVDSARRAGMPVVGAGCNAAEAYAPHFVVVRGIRLAVVALSQVHELAATWRATPARPGNSDGTGHVPGAGGYPGHASERGRRDRQMHWGVEGSPCPSAEMKTFALRAAREGADIVSGTHAHSCSPVAGSVTPTCTIAWATSSGTATRTAPKPGCCG